MGYRGVIFDLDGVLCSTDEFHYLAWKSLAEDLGIPFDRKINLRLRGVSRMQSLEILLERAEKVYSDEEKLAFAERKNELYRNYLDRLEPKDVAPDGFRVLETLKLRKIRLAVGSSSKNTPLILRRLGIVNLFDAVADGNDISRSKPDPEVFLLAAKRLDLSPRECLVVEDAESGIEAGIAGGFDTAAIGFELPRATYFLHGLAEILQYV